jgi:imidazoleglycerol phosphate synthase glutamine amidotransferase subunit HisH
VFAGLGLLPGVAKRFVVDLPIPHVGWARVEPTGRGPFTRHAPRRAERG